MRVNGYSNVAVITLESHLHISPFVVRSAGFGLVYKVQFVAVRAVLTEQDFFFHAAFPELFFSVC